MHQYDLSQVKLWELFYAKKRLDNIKVIPSVGKTEKEKCKEFP